MIKQAILLTTVIALSSILVPAYANSDTSCAVEVAVAVSAMAPAGQKHYVAFNVANENGLNRSITLSMGQGPTVIRDIPCANGDVTISATAYTVNDDTYSLLEPVGKCRLKGSVSLRYPGDSVSVVYPFDFVC